MESTRSSTIIGTAWTLAERLSVQMIQFIIGIILARLLAPEAYGMIGLLGIFLGLAQICLDCGFGNALIRKKDKTDVDYSTVFYFNLAVSLLMYGILFALAPVIAKFYKIPELTQITRVISATICLNALTLVHNAKLTYELNFKLQAIAAISSVVLSGAIGIWMAYQGYGVWALVGQSVWMSIIRAIILWCSVKWKPLLQFSITSFKEMFAYGSKLLAGSIIHTIYTNLYTLSIGKIFNATDTGYFNRANTYGQLPNELCNQVVSKVFFPVLSRKQDDIPSMIEAYRKMIKTMMFVYVPFMLGMSALSLQLVEILIGPKWLPCVPLLKILCIGFSIAPLSSVNLNLLYVAGRSDLTLKLDIIKKIIGITILGISLPFGLWWVCLGKAFYEIVAFSFNSYYTKKMFNYGAFAQIRDLLPTFIMSGIMFVFVTLTLHFINNVYLQLLVGFGVGATSYLAMSILSRNESLKTILELIPFLQHKRYNE